MENIWAYWKVTNKVLEYILRMYVIDKLGKWEYYLHLVEFSYNNYFQVSVGICPADIMYELKCNTPFLEKSIW